ncbi:G-protein coupled receptor Mth2 isoform X2 [Folsomia candida]|uniref:G-protein coupled receptor Mth2 isoform X2 n=1 Tax=Folsomia candida TaxID=158441 RepID=UPI001605298E|nr:G-protein coupled receptor Mth2 isoform X2 [Folsomia candida]
MRVYYFLLLFFALYFSTNSVSSSTLFLCKDYSDLRFSSENDTDFNVTTIIEENFLFVPKNLMSNNASTTFGLMNPSSLKCHQKTVTLIMQLGDGDAITGSENNGTSTTTTTSTTTMSPRHVSLLPLGKVERPKGPKKPPTVPKHVKLRGKIGPFFTPEGYLEYNHAYYNPQDFCVSRISNEEIEVQICPLNCSRPGHLCLPKCCGVGEVLVYWNFTCMPTPTPWTPFLYDDVHTRLSPKELKALEVHYVRPTLNCKWEEWAFSEVKRPRKNTTKPPDPAFFLRVLKDGSIMHININRRWSKMSPELYCIDGFVNWSEGGGNVSYVKDEDHQVVLKCPPLPNNSSSSKIDARKDDLYAGVMYVASVFPFLTALVLALLFDRQNIHGLTILSNCVSLFFFYVTHGTVYYMAQRRNLLGDNRSPTCLSIAILSHFFFLTTFAWLTVVNFDLWLTFRSMRPISKMSKKMRRFRLYSFIGWGVPFLFMAVFVFLDFHYRDFRTEFIVPDYGIKSCYVASWARREYICSIVSTIIPINIILIVSTFKIFYDFDKGKNIMPKRVKGDKYSFHLFLKLFLVMGSIWSFDAIFCWFYNNGEQSPWFIMILDCAMFLQAIAIFVIFCCNRRTMKQLEEKYPCFKTYFFSRVQTTQKIVENSRTHDRQYGNDASHAGTGGEKNVHAFNIDIRNDGQEEDDDTIGQPSTNVIDDAKDATS